MAPEATGGFHQCSVPKEVEWALDASHQRDVCDGFTGAGAVQRATYFTSFDHKHSEAKLLRKNGAQRRRLI